ncbi:metal-dependent hydrolase [Anoxybacteroides rupiense]|uniref:metal-dependent hydrolase n=1 Tax=Anoxybacteroides rupiense TaxID=311460 RepID=UPI001606C669|nr:metal-dependent hydrolase [Anoxybacillus rupiensis]MBB3905825.1 inner membrane protein [Anoxybacillus rupiensis]
MRYHTHVVTSLCIGAAIASQTSLPFTISYTAGIIAGSLLPDIDEPKSYVGRRSLGAAQKVKQAFGHRGMTHSLFVWAVLALIIMLESPSVFARGLVLGYLLHILEDFLSVQGVPLFWPLQDKRYKIPLYRTGSRLETVLFYGSFSLLIYIASQYQLFHEWLRSLRSFFQQIW